MALPSRAEILLTLHSPGEWTLHDDREVYSGPYTATLTGPPGRPDFLEGVRYSIDSLTLSRAVAPAPSSSEEEDPEEGSTPPQSSEELPPRPDIPESSRAREPAFAERMVGFLTPHMHCTDHASPWLYPEFLSPEELARAGYAPIDWDAEMRLPQDDAPQPAQKVIPQQPAPEVIVLSDDDEEMPDQQPEAPVEAADPMEEEEEEIPEYMPADPPEVVVGGYWLGPPVGGEMEYGPGPFVLDSDEEVEVSGCSSGDDSLSSVGTGYSWT